ncbi:hypothetical protein OKW36_002784 [Paraburkholderia sp. MM5482-R1]
MNAWLVESPSGYASVSTMRPLRRSFGQIVHEIFADHEAREFHGIDRQILAAQRSDRKSFVSHALGVLESVLKSVLKPTASRQARSRPTPTSSTGYARQIRCTEASFSAPWKSTWHQLLYCVHPAGHTAVCMFRRALRGSLKPRVG